LCSEHEEKESKLYDLEDCHTCKSESFCSMLSFALISDFIYHVTICPCRECLIKPICSTSCEDRRQVLVLNLKERGEYVIF
jgi:hypothetical protein